MSTTPRIKSAIPGEDEHFFSLLAHQPLLAERLNALYGTFWQKGLLDQRIKEMTRIRNARITDCGF